MFYEEIWIIIPKFFLLPLPICSTEKELYRFFHEQTLKKKTKKKTATDPLVYIYI